MQFGLCVATHIDNIELIEHAERLGFDRAWVPDSQMIWSDCYATLALAAQRTSRSRTRSSRCCGNGSGPG